MLNSVTKEAAQQTLPLCCADQVGPEGVVIREALGQDSPYLPAAMKMFQAIFPDYERYIPDLPISALQRSPEHPDTVDHLWVFEQAGKPIGIRVFRYLMARNVGYGAFIGLLEPYRDHGICSWAVKQSLAQLCADARSLGRPEPPGYVVEVEPVSAAKTEADRIVNERRLAFHLKNKAYFLDVDYYEPPTVQGLEIMVTAELINVSPAPMQLAFYPVHTGARLTADELTNVIKALYLDYYRLKPESWYVRRALASVKKRG